MLDPTQMPMPREPMSGNTVPPGALPSEVRDDVDIKASEGEYIIPADVVRYIGLEKIEGMIAKAQKDLQSLAEGGRIGGKPLPPEPPPMAPEGPPMAPPGPRGMDEGGLVYNPKEGGNFDGYASGADLLLQMFNEAESFEPLESHRSDLNVVDKSDRNWFPMSDRHFNSDTLGAPFYARHGLNDVASERGLQNAPDALHRSDHRQVDSENIRFLTQILRELDNSENISPRLRAFQNNAHKYLAGRTGMAEGGLVNTSLPQATMQAYMGPDGQIVYIPVMNGQPIATVPQGYTPTDAAPRQAAPTSNARSRDRASGQREVRTSTPVEQWSPDRFIQHGNQLSSGVGDFVTGAAGAMIPGFGLINRLAENNMRNTAPGVLQNMIDTGVDSQGNPITPEQMEGLRRTQSAYEQRYSDQPGARRNPLQAIGDFLRGGSSSGTSERSFTQEGSNVRTGQRKSTPRPTSEGFSSSGALVNRTEEDTVKKAFYSGGMVAPPQMRQPSPIQPPAARNPRVGFMNKRNP